MKELKFSGYYKEDAIKSNLTKYLKSALPKDREIIFCCVGTDRSTGDAFGPTIGMFLEQRGMTVYGTLNEPVHAMNLGDTLLNISRSHKEPFIVAIDACLGQVSSVGMIKAHHGSIRPGAGVNKELPPVGDLAITGIVNVGGFMEYFVLQNTRLSLVYAMSLIVSDAIVEFMKERSMKRSPMKATVAKIRSVWPVYAHR